MTSNEFIAIVNKYGEDQILAFNFDNSASITFGLNDEFKMDVHFDSEISCFKFASCDLRGNPYFTLIPIEHLQSITIKHPDVYIGLYDRVRVRG